MLSVLLLYRHGALSGSVSEQNPGRRALTWQVVFASPGAAPRPPVRLLDAGAAAAPSPATHAAVALAVAVVRGGAAASAAAALVNGGGRAVEPVLPIQLPLLDLLGLRLAVRLLPTNVVGHAVHGDDFCGGGDERGRARRSVTAGKPAAPSSFARECCESSERK